LITNLFSSQFYAADEYNQPLIANFTAEVYKDDGYDSMLVETVTTVVCIILTFTRKYTTLSLANTLHYRSQIHYTIAHIYTITRKYTTLSLANTLHYRL
jgi:hypothetical protein